MTEMTKYVTAHLPTLWSLYTHTHTATGTQVRIHAHTHNANLSLNHYRME